MEYSTQLIDFTTQLMFSSALFKEMNRQKQEIKKDCTTTYIRSLAQVIFCQICQALVKARVGLAYLDPMRNGGLATFKKAIFQGSLFPLALLAGMGLVGCRWQGLHPTAADTGQGGWRVTDHLA